MLVGRPVRRREDERILRGEARYLDDVERPGVAHVAFVRSAYAHARARVNKNVAGGALLLLTADDLVGVQSLPVQGAEGVELLGPAHPVLARGEVGWSTSRSNPFFHRVVRPRRCCASRGGRTASTRRLRRRPMS